MSYMSLEDFKSQFDLIFSRFLDSKMPEIEVVSPHLRSILESSRNMWTEGGKRIRPYLCTLAYQAYGGTDVPAILFASFALELLHVFALVHDDIIDQSETRRGYKTLHTALTKQHLQKKLHGDASHFGVSLAILIGDLLFSFSNEIVTQISFPKNYVERAQKLFYTIQQQLLLGEYEDVQATAQLESVTEDQVIRLMSRKSGRYSIEQPLQFGTILSGKSEVYAKTAFGAFSKPLGIAFQLQDDILGTFGDPKKLGKPTDSDIRQGKPTLMVVYALKKISGDTKRTLLDILGNQQATEKEIQYVRKILQKTGSDTYARKRAEEFSQEAQTALAKMLDLPSTFTEALTALTKFIVTRAN